MQPVKNDHLLRRKPGCGQGVIDKVVAASGREAVGGARELTAAKMPWKFRLCRGSWLIVLSAIPYIRNYSPVEGIQPAARPNWGGIDHSGYFAAPSKILNVEKARLDRFWPTLKFAL